MWRFIEFVDKTTFYALSGLPLTGDDFWDRALSIRAAVTRYAYYLLDELANSGLAKAVEDFKIAMHTAITWAGKLETDINKLLTEQESLLVQSDHINVNEISVELAERFNVVLEELQVMFPAPDSAPKHELRVNITGHALTRAEEEFVALLLRLGLSENQTLALQGDFEKLKPHVRDVIVTVGECRSGSSVYACHLSAPLVTRR